MSAFKNLNMNFSRRQIIAFTIFSVLFLCATLVYRANFKSYFQSELIKFDGMNIRLRHSTVNMLMADGFVPATKDHAHVFEKRMTINPFSHIPVIHLRAADTGCCMRNDCQSCCTQTRAGPIARPGRNRIRSIGGGIPMVKNALTIMVYPVNNSGYQMLLADAPIYRVAFMANLNPMFTIFDHTFTSDMSLSDVRNLLSGYEERRSSSVNNEILFSRNDRTFRLNFIGGVINCVAIGFIPRSFETGRSLDDAALLLSVLLLLYCAKNWFGILRGRQSLAA